MDLEDFEKVVRGAEQRIMDRLGDVERAADEVRHDIDQLDRQVREHVLIAKRIEIQTVKDLERISRTLYGKVGANGIVGDVKTSRRDLDTLAKFSWGVFLFFILPLAVIVFWWILQRLVIA